MSDRATKCTPEEWAAFWKIGQIRAIASPGFAAQVNLARAEGLLESLLLGDSDMVARRASELIASLSAQIRPEYPPAPDQFVAIHPPHADVVPPLSVVPSNMASAQPVTPCLTPTPPAEDRR